MQRCLSQKFYHKDYEYKGIRRWIECHRFMTSSPYNDIYSHINFSSLNRNSKIKYLLFKFNLYGLSNYLLNKYNASKGKLTYMR